MKVLMLTTSFPRSPGGDYAGSFILELAKSLVKDGVEVVVLAPHDTETKNYEIWDGVVIHRFQYFWPKRLHRLCYGAGIISNLKHSLLALLQFPLLIFFFMWNALRLSKTADIIHAQWMLCGAASVLVKKLTKKPVILTILGSDLNRVPKNIIFKMVYLKIFKSSDQIICCSNALKGNLLEIFPDESKISVIHNCVDSSVFKSKRAKTGKVENILYVGRLSQEKGVSYLIEAFINVLREFPQLKLNIVGVGPLRGSLTELSKKNGVSSNIDFMGFVGKERLIDLYQNCDIFVLPSLSEGLPLSIIEAMSCGVPVIASNVGGIPEVISDGETGLLVSPKDVDGLSNAIIKLVDDKKLRDEIRQNAINLVTKNFTIQYCSQNTEKVYSKALDTSGGK